MTAATLSAFALILLLTGCASLKTPSVTPSSDLSDDGVFSLALARYAQGMLLEADADGRASSATGALDAYLEAQRLDPTAAAPLARCTVGLLEADRSAEAYTIFAAYATRLPQDAEAWISLGHIAENAQKHHQAAEAFAHAIALQGDANSETALAEVRNRFLANEDGKALGTLRRLLGTASPVSEPLAQAPLLWARHFILKTQAPQRALPVIQIMIDTAASADKKAAAQTFYGDALLRAGNTNRAVRSYWQALKTVPTHMPATRRIGAALARQGDIKSIKRLSRRIASAPAPLAPALVAANAWRVLEDPEKAAATLLAGRAAALKRGTQPPAHYDLELGALLHDLERDRQAAEIFCDALTTHTHAHPIMNHLAYMWAVKNENLDKAQQWAERALTYEPRNYAYIDTLGWIYYRQDRFVEALHQLLLAIRLAPHDDSIIFDHAGDTLQALGRSEEALAFWRRALALTPDMPHLQQKIDHVTAARNKPDH